MIAHVVLFRPRKDLPTAEAQPLLDALSRALQNIPSIRRAHIGSRVRVGAEYEQLAQPDFPYAAVIEFDDRDGLRAYLEHPAHETLAMHFWASLEATQVFDFEMENNASGLSALINRT